MGLIQKQSTAGVIWSYVGVGLGFLSSALLFPRLLEKEEIGLLRVLVSYATLLAMFSSLGMNSVAVKMFPQFRDDKNGHHGFLGLALIFTLGGFIITTIVYLLLKDVMIERSREDSALFIPYFYTVIPLTFCIAFFGILDSYFRMLFNAVKGIVYKQVYQRVLIIVGVLLYFLGYLDFSQFVWAYILAYFIPFAMMVFVLHRQNNLHIKPDIAFFNPNIRREMFSVALFGIFGGLPNVLLQSIDSIMVNEFLGLEFTGVYTINFFFGTLILIPIRTMARIGSVVISEAWKKNDVKVISEVYTKSSITLTIIGLLFFIGVWGNIDNVYKLVGEEYSAGRFVIFFISIANLTEMYVGLSTQILVNSKYYKWQTYLLVIFSILIITTNFIFIPIFGIVGAAVASFVSKLIFNLLKFGFIYNRFKLHPFSIKHIYITLFAIGAWYVSTLIPQFSFYIFDIIIRSVALGLMFMLPVYYFNISEDINTRIDKILAMAGIRLR